MRARYVHTNLIARDWRKLAEFYVQVFGCARVGPERDLKGKEIEAGTSLSGAEIRGAHLRLPGHGADGPTLEVFEYGREERRAKTAVNRPGFQHIAFSVEDVHRAREQVLAAGGGALGEVVTVRLGDDSRLTWTYVTDPEGNVIELQSRPAQPAD